MSRSKYQELANNAADKYGIDRSIFSALIQTESSWKPGAVGAAGEVGLAQLMPKTAKMLGVNPWVPSQNLDGAARYLAKHLETYGNYRDALSRYNAGINLNGGRGYADKVIAASGKLPEELGGAPTESEVKNSKLFFGGVRLEDVYKPTNGESVGKDSEVKRFLKKFGLWAVAILLIGLGIWKLVK